MMAWAKIGMGVAAGLLMCGMTQAVLAQDPSPPTGMIDKMSDPARWNVYKDEKVTKVDLAAVDAKETKSGKAINVTYEMGDGAWLGFVNSIDQDLTGYKGVRFAYCGQGNANSVEFKLEDSDGSVFGKILKTKSNIGSWTVVEIPFTDLSYWWGGDNKLTWENVHNINFAISKKGGDDKGGTGAVSVSQLEFYK